MEKICANERCTLCMACANVCPPNAIYIDIDETGYECVKIDAKRCIDCGLCRKVCGRRKEIERKYPHSGYAAQANEKKALMNSASGGAFQMLAEYVLENHGVCYGCNAYQDEDGFHAKHMRIDSLGDLHKILNSKYIPSMIGGTYLSALQDLKKGKLVLFSGTPCQIQGLKAFLNKDYEKLLTADIICHGVTATKMFNDYVRAEEEKYDIKISEFQFRDKGVSWGTNFCYSYCGKNNPDNTRIRHLPREASSYMVHYLRGNIFRENCYSCPLSNTFRVSDFTLGDYWEIEREHPEFITRYNPKIVLRRGVSCILANTEKADGYINALREKMIMYEVSIDSIVSHNGNLRQASPRGKERDQVLKNYREKGYASIQQDYEGTVGKKMLVYKMKNVMKAFLPDVIRIFIYNNSTLSKMIFHE